MYCANCGSAVVMSDKYCSKCGTPVHQQIEPALGPALTAPKLSDHLTSSFRDHTKLTLWLKYFLYTSIVISVIAIFSGALQYQLLTDFKAGVYTSESLASAAADSNDKRQQILGVFQFVIDITTIILFSVWIYRANFTARQLGAKGMTFTPGWAVGWFFIPFANLWKPYQAMKEIWRASKNPDAWQSEHRGAILPWWWLFFVLMGIFGNASLKASLKAKEINELLTATGLSMAADLISVPASILAVVMVRQIFEMQMTYGQPQGRAPIIQKAHEVRKCPELSAVKNPISVIHWALGLSALALFGVAAGIIANGLSTTSETDGHTAKNADAVNMAQVSLTRIVVAARDIETGTTLDESNLTLAQWPLDKVPNGAFTRVVDVVGRIAVVRLAAGQPLIAAERVAPTERVAVEVVDSSLKPGFRAVTIQTNETFISPDVVVDVVSINSGHATTILEGIRVLAVSSEETSRGKNATLEVTPNQAEALLNYSNKGPIELVLRNSMDFSTRK